MPVKAESGLVKVSSSLVVVSSGLVAANSALVKDLPGVGDSTPPTPTPDTAPGAPASLTGTPTVNGMTLTWTAPSDDGGAAITKYQFRHRRVGTTAWAPDWTDVPGGDGTTRTHTISSLTGGSLYLFQVRAVNSIGAGASRARQATPAAALSFGASTIAAQSWTVRTAVNLTLPQATGGVGTISYDLSPSLPSGVSRSARVVSGTPTAAATSATYTWSATAGSETVELTFTVVVAAAVPLAPRNLAATNGVESSVLTWDAPTSDGGAAISKYQYRSQASGGSFGAWTDVSGGGTARTVTVSSLTGGTTYTFEVRAVNSVGNSAADSTTATPTSAATPLSFGSSTIANQSWTFGSSVALTLPVATGGTGTITYDLSPALPTGVTRTDRVVSGTPSATAASATYTWTATAGSESVSLTFTIVVAAAVPGTPRNLAATAGDGEVDLTWDAPTSNGGSAITSYQYRVDSGSWVTVSGGGTARSVTVGSLTNGTSYEFVLRAVNAIGNSAATSMVLATPAEAVDTTVLPDSLPSGWFTLPAQSGEVARMWIETGTPSSNYVWGESPRPVVGSVYRNDSAIFPSPGPTLNGVRIPAAGTLRLHGSGGSFSTYIGQNNGTGSEPNLSFYIFTAADSSAEFRFDGIINAGGGFVNWSLESTLEETLRTAGTQLILVLADAS